VLITRSGSDILIRPSGDPCTVNSRKVLAGLDEMKADYNQNYINYFTGEHKGEKFTKINPHATVPAATDGDLTITESVCLNFIRTSVVPPY
jgi:glutathione S-transferase